uniref:Uncharacterized protein n=1 Tax=Candidatus Kentrum sp. LPFa TaxID=2126335 RepID=A0A450W3V8_9GAMM|nr:MAG: hypothetical protein BECKLPF1236A_GA0070988_1006010 [Candidatus Kentron sp. LPFa]
MGQNGNEAPRAPYCAGYDDEISGVVATFFMTTACSMPESDIAT